ncbi:hypothetical protein MMAN_09660 [Mycobacterium mantenii]|uniref:DUF262 domain-containing protein n=1 Tax=Mycobacterium mantenii TaxID=560555 RepID=A0A1X0G0F3_MYCNT|nr:DUF262 domain-containing protein [Mycobacterium mantenii]MCV7244744.1 DUF262 domain-containing protein [Mycobacterium mantenii]ORB07511.1 hypothetical protein BST30_06055 [Mycobacterium mantenii]BBY36832.1 hypothetical protein MMAN_09660 [Mycobacterium mantenii]
MKAVDANLLDLLKKATQFVVPIYQRVYSWDDSECDQLWRDIVRAGSSEVIGAHFTGSIVYVEKDQGNIAQAEPALIIDGQQRTTTVTLLLAALAAHLDLLPIAEQEPVDSFAPRKIRGLWLTNEYESGDKFFKLILSKADKEALKAVVRNDPLPAGNASRVLTNFQFFVSKLKDPATDIVAVCKGVSKLVVVDVHLARGVDNPQLVFEAMNSTGKKLSQADLIRNFVLMDLEPNQQTKLYEGYWFPMEQAFRGVDERRFDEFVRHFLTVRTGAIPRLEDIYDAFKDFSFAQAEVGVNQEAVVMDLSRSAKYFVAMAMGQETNPKLATRFIEIEQLKATVAYPFLLRVYQDYDSGKVSDTEFAHILDVVISYLFRRTICRIPTNSLNKTFVSLGLQVNPLNYVQSVFGRFLTLDTYKRFPDDEEFGKYLCEEDLYHLQRAPYFLAKMENDSHKEPISVGDYTIEHVMPQNEKLSQSWQDMIGPDWVNVQGRWLHTLGNLTLTGYNPELSDRPFLEKRDMAGGFKDSHLQLNKSLAALDTWNEDAIVARAKALADQAIKLWKRPSLPPEVLADYRNQFKQEQGFDWSLTHEILARIPQGRWTGYYYLAEAVGTSAQAVANHVSKCPTCVNAYRVLTWDGHVAEGFAWTDPNDTRKPKEVLEAEGVSFSTGAADPDAKLAAEDLLALVELGE